jgi:hypothetical protein
MFLFFVFNGIGGEVMIMKQREDGVGRGTQNLKEEWGEPMATANNIQSPQEDHSTPTPERSSEGGDHSPFNQFLRAGEAPPAPKVRRSGSPGIGGRTQGGTDAHQF